MFPGVTMQGESSPACCRNDTTFPVASVMLVAFGMACAPWRVERRAKGSMGAKAEADAMKAKMSTGRTMLGSGFGDVNSSRDAFLKALKKI